MYGDNARWADDALHRRLAPLQLLDKAVRVGHLSRVMI